MDEHLWNDAPSTFSAAVRRVASRALARARDIDPVLIGIVGAPGSGKSTFALELVSLLRQRGLDVGYVPMDGFHLADHVLDDLGLREVKGRIDTFDAWGYLSALRRMATRSEPVVYCPSFSRTLEQPLAGGIAIPNSVDVIVTEGNYLLDPEEPWPLIRELLDEVGCLEVDDRVRRERLVRRHIEFGKPAREAEAWVQQVDEPNAQRVKAARSNADYVLSLLDE